MTCILSGGLFRSDHVWAHCSASDSLRVCSPQSEEEEREEGKSVGFQYLAFITADSITWFPCFQH